MTMMSANNSTKPKGRGNSARINAAKAAKKIPTAILLERKAKCDAEALKIVERLIEPQIEVSWLLRSLGQINRSHLQDVIEERAILKCCGYVLCDNPLTKVIKKKYEISTRNNKVYDVQCTKDFCSFWCYSASQYLLDQMLTSPLWLRNEEYQAPEFKIFDQPKEKVKNAPGVEVNIIGIDLPSDKNDSSEPEVKEKNDESMDSKSTIDQDKPLDDGRLVSNECSMIIDEMSTEIESEIMHTSATGIIGENVNVPIKTGVFEKSIPTENEKLKRKSKFSRDAEKRKKLKEKSPVSFEVLIAQVEKNITEWITEDTIGLLHGDDLVKQKLLENVAMQERYGELCKKLNSIQLEEEKEDRVAAIQSNVLKPAPHFSILQEEAQALELKVRAFYQGSPVIETPTVKVEAKSENDVETTVVPLTAAHDPIALRRRIFLDKLNKTLPDLLRTLSGPGQFQYIYTPERIAKVKALVYTFKLSATNIVFKSAQWTLVALLVIKILSIIDNNIDHILRTKQATMYISMILMSYKLNSNYLDQLITSLTISKNSKGIEDNDCFL